MDISDTSRPTIVPELSALTIRSSVHLPSMNTENDISEWVSFSMLILNCLRMLRNVVCTVKGRGKYLSYLTRDITSRFLSFYDLCRILLHGFPVNNDMSRYTQVFEPWHQKQLSVWKEQDNMAEWIKMIKRER